MSDRALVDAGAETRRSADGPLTLATWLCLVAVIPPYLRVVDSGPWVLEIAVLAALILTAGYLARRRRLPAVAVSLLGLVVWTLFVTFTSFRETALLWVIPTPDTIDAVRFSLGAASLEIQNSAAPVAAGAAMSFLLVASMGLLAIIIDHVALSARMPLLAAVGLVAVTLVPPFVVPGDVDIVGFVFLAIAILLLVRAETRGRQPVPTTASGGPGLRTVSGAALAIGAIAIVVALVVTPLLPRPTANASFGPGAATISTNLSLGDDLRRPREVQVLFERTSASDAPYLRVSTLTRFDGTVWLSDRLRGTPIEQDGSLGEVAVADGIRVEDVTTSVRVVNLASPWLPVSYPATGVEGLRGEWLGVPYNRTVVSDQTDSREQSYSITSRVPRPTLDQVRALETGGAGVEPETRELPDGLPSVIGELAGQVTAGATNDHDRLALLQDWFRGSEFEYSLEAPVEAGFDGSGAEAVAEFLTRREGYCVHFASAFAIMARTLGMPSRVVVGYLPGQPTADTIDGETVYSVSSSQLHAWPEVYFDGLGWLAWEPTKSLGVATAFSATAGGSDAAADDLAPSTSPLPSVAPDDEIAVPLETAMPTDASGAGRLDPAPALWVTLGLVVAFLVPALVRAVQSRVALARARRGSAAAAWVEVRAFAVDMGIEVSPSESPRVLGARLVAAGAPSSAVSLLVSAIEHASYAPRVARPDAARPAIPRPDAARPANARPDAARPANARPDAARPANARPDAARPAIARPDAAGRGPAGLGPAGLGHAGRYAAGLGPPDIEPDDIEPDETLPAAVVAVREGLMSDAGRWRSAVAVLAPRSLITRPARAPASIS